MTHAERNARYAQTDKGRAAAARKRSRYRATERGRAVEKAARERYWASEKGRAAQRRYAATDKSRERYKRQYELDRDSGKNAARKAVAKAIAKGTLTRGPCLVCGAEKVHAHHPLGYGEHRLTVEWFCPKHHYAVHH